MDIRELCIPGQQALAKVNARHPWNHNDYFHGWILRNLPARRSLAVDVGCGKGVLVGKLATQFAHVTGIDRNEGMTAAASERLRGVPQVNIQQRDFADFASAADDGQADLITMVAVLHHMNVGDALARIPRLLAPGGRLLVVGLARPNSVADLAFDAVSGAANPVVGMIKHPHAVRPGHPSLPAPDAQPAVPMMDPTTTLAEITKAAKTHLPGCRVRRRLFFRYTLSWEKPATRS
jgi:SAM-dependent methyltransferase